MLAISTTQFRAQMFECLNKVADGETLVLLKNKKEIARIVPPGFGDWRDKMPARPIIKTSPETLMQPMENEWEEYL